MIVFVFILNLASIAAENKDFILVGDMASEIYKISASNGLRTKLLSPFFPNANFTELTAVSYDEASDSIYFSDYKTNSIYRLVTDPPELKLIFGPYPGGRFSDITIDSASELMFVADDGEIGEVFQLQLNGKNKKTLYKALGSKPAALEFDNINRTLYWVDFSKSFVGLYKLEIAMNNSLPVQIIKDGLEAPWALAIDFNAGLMFWGDADKHRIERSNLMGLDRLILFQDNSTRFFDFSINRQILYYTDAIDKSSLKVFDLQSMQSKIHSYHDFKSPRCLWYHQVSPKSSTTFDVPKIIGIVVGGVVAIIIFIVVIVVCCKCKKINRLAAENKRATTTLPLPNEISENNHRSTNEYDTAMHNKNIPSKPASDYINLDQMSNRVDTDTEYEIVK